MKSQILDKIKNLEEEMIENDVYDYVEQKSKYILKLIAILGLLYNTLIVMLGYNWIVPELYNVPKITYMQAFMLDLLITFLYTNKFSEEDLVERSAVYKYVKFAYILILDTIILGLMFIAHFFV